MHGATQSDWAEGLHLTVTGLNKDQRKQVKNVVEAAGGRYSPNFSKRCTHLIVSSEQSDASQLKVYLASINKDKWHAQAVRFEWLMECATQHQLVVEDGFAVQPPRHEDVSLIQQRLQEVATPTVSEVAAGSASAEAATLLGASKRYALDTEVHSNITTRSAPKQASKRYKHADSQMQQRQPEDVNKPLEASASGRQAIPAASLFQADPPARPALAPSSMQVAQQSACLKWPRPPCKPPASCSAVSTAGRDSGNMQTDGPRFDTSTNPLSSSLSRAQTQRHPAQTIPQGNSSGTLGAGTHGAGNLASRLHAMQADAVDRAWQRQHEAERLAHIAVPSLASSSASAAAAPLLLTHKPEPSGPMPVSGTSRHNGTVKQQHCCGMGQQGKSLSSNSRSLAAAITCSKPAVQCAEPSLPTSSQPTVRLHTTCKPAADPQAVSDRHTDLMPENRGADLSTDTESLVAKLRALSQGRSDCAHSKASSKLSGQQQPRRPFACRAADCNQPQPSIADPNALPPSKRSKQAGMQTSVAAAAAGAGQAAAVAPSQPRPNTARCIQLTEPVHSGTEYGSGTSPKRRSRRLQPQGSPTASNRPRSAYASVAAPIQLGAPTEQLPAAALPGPTPAPSVAAAADPSRVHQQAPASPVQHRLGKPTPLKKGFTPKPSRFRLEAERLSITPPDKSSGLEKVLFRSPVKVAAAASRAAVGCSNDNVLSASCFAAAAPQAGVMTMPEIAQQPHAAQAVPGLPDPCSEHLAGHGASQEMVTPANGCISSMQADPPGVFAHMKVILDPELSPEESHRMSQAVRGGGGQVMAGTYLGTGATHVVCHPQTAVKWLAMGLSIVSPPWLLRSLAQGTPDPCLHMSLDASRHLPTSAPPVSPASAQPAWHDPSSSLHSTKPPQDLSGREARQSFVQHLQAQEALQHWGSAQQALQTPQTMLDEVVWCVSDAPQLARLDTLHPAVPLADAQSNSLRPHTADVDMADCNSQLSATQEACQAELQEIESMCGTSGQAEAAPAGQQVGRSLQEEDWHEVLYKAPALTLLMPLDSMGACGHGSRSLPVPPHGCTRQQLLQCIYSFYQEQLDVSEQMQMMKGSSRAASIVKEVFVEGKPVKRLSLLHSKVNVEGLERVSRDLTGTIYELKLSC